MKKRSFLLALFTLLCFIPAVASCSNNEANNTTNNTEGTIESGSDTKPSATVTPEETETTRPESSETTKPEGSETTKPEGSETTNPESGETTEPSKPVEPEIEYESVKDALTLANTITPTEKESFSNEELYIKGEVIADFAMSSTYHLMIVADNTGIIPVAVAANKQSLDKYLIGNMYTIRASYGNYRNTACLKALEHPTREENDNSIDYKKLAKEGSISSIYERSYELKYKENNPAIANEITSFNATYVKKIESSLMLVFDGTKHIILHGDNKCTNGMQENKNYTFYAMPSVYRGKHSAEYIGSEALGTDNPTVMDSIKASAVDKRVEDLFNVDRYNDNGLLYPNIFHVSGYVKAHVKNNDYHLALVDDLKVNVTYQKNVNERPKAIYLKNHVFNDFNFNLDNLYPYFALEEKVDLYFVITDYQSEYHVYHGFVIDSLTKELEMPNEAI